MFNSSWSFCIALFMTYKQFQMTFSDTYHKNTNHSTVISRLWVESSRMTHINKVVEESRIERFGQGVPGEGGLLRVQSDRNSLRLATPLAVHDATGQFILQTVLINSQQV